MGPLASLAPDGLGIWLRSSAREPTLIDCEESRIPEQNHCLAAFLPREGISAPACLSGNPCWRRPPSTNQLGRRRHFSQPPKTTCSRSSCCCRVRLLRERSSTTGYETATCVAVEMAAAFGCLATAVHSDSWSFVRTCTLRHRIVIFWLHLWRRPVAAKLSRSSHSLKVFPFAYLGRVLEYLHGIGDSVFCTVWADHVKKNRFLILGWFGVSWVRLVVVPVLGVYRCLSCIVSISRVCGRTRAQGRVFNDLLLYKYNNIYLFIKRGKDKHKNIKHINTRVRK